MQGQDPAVRGIEQERKIAAVAKVLFATLLRTSRSEKGGRPDLLEKICGDYVQACAAYREAHGGEVPADVVAEAVNLERVMGHGRLHEDAGDLRAVVVFGETAVMEAVFQMVASTLLRDAVNAAKAEHRFAAASREHREALAAYREGLANAVSAGP